MSLYYYLIVMNILFILLFLWFFYLIKNYYKQLINYIKNAIEPRFVTINLTPETKAIIQLAIDYWRLEERIETLKNEDDTNFKKLQSSLWRIGKYIKQYWIEIKDFKWDKYSEDILAIEVKSTEITLDKNQDMFIKDIIQPAIFVNWQLIEKAKVIVYKYDKNNTENWIEEKKSSIEIIETK